MADLDESQDYEVDFMTMVIDKADNLKILDCDKHFCEFSGFHKSKINQGKFFLHDIIPPQNRENIMKKLCKKNSNYIYFNCDILNKNKEPVYVYCTAHNYENSTACRLTIADVSRSREKREALEAKANDMNNMIELVSCGVCLYRVTSKMHIEVIYVNKACCELFSTTKTIVSSRNYRLDELIHKDDKSAVFQAIGACLATGENIDMEFRIIVHDGIYRWVKFNSSIQKYDEENNPVFNAVFTDITNLK